MIRTIASGQFPPFGNFRLQFPPVPDKPDELAEVHLLTGINGTGKTRILSMLAAMLGQVASLGKRVREHPGSTTIVFSDVVLPYGTGFPNASPHLGVTQGQVGRGGSGNFFQWLNHVPAFAFSGSPYVADAPIAVLGSVPKPDRAACLAFGRLEGNAGVLLQAVANLKVRAGMEQLEGLNTKSGLGHGTQITLALESAISAITGRKFAFAIKNYAKPIFNVLWDDEPLTFDSLPDGLRSIIGWLANAVVMMDALNEGTKNPFLAESIFLLDEVEGFLHPAWQRKILPAFQRLFPKAQMFVATHSPFLIASLNHGWIHQLSLKPDNRVEVEQPKLASEGDSYVRVVEEIMGVSEWYDPETEQMLSEFRALRESAYAGNAEARNQAHQLAVRIGDRSTELSYMMGREVQQMERQLGKLFPAP